MQRLHSQTSEASEAMPAARPRTTAGKGRAARPARRTYHHGDLRRALVDEALRLAAEGGIEAVNIREAARRAGVSPGAPFRHFPDRIALMTAVAEEAARRFRGEVDAALAGAPGDDPLARFRSIGLAYPRSAMRTPAQFVSVS